MKIPFYKYEGIGNDFLIVDTADLKQFALSREIVKRVCDRHFGIGADGILLVNRKTTPISMQVHNADGSTSEMCGNGIRCVVKYLVDHNFVRAESVKIATKDEVRECQILDGAQRVRVDMGNPIFEPAKVPLKSATPWLDHEVSHAGVTKKVTVVSMGNPHAVVFDLLETERDGFVDALAQDSVFSAGVNVGHATIEKNGHLNLQVKERGVGWTQACGTGACAAAVAAVETGRISQGENISVILPGGELSISYEKKGERVWMTGPARHVYTGELDVANFR